MRRRIAPVHLPPPSRGNGRLLYQDVYAQLRYLILGGGVHGGDRIPSTRKLARDLGVSRNTVLRAFELLRADGLLEGQIGAGTWVADTVVRLPPKRTLARLGDLSSRGRVLTRLPTGRETAPLHLTPSTPALDEFPLAEWRRISARVTQSLTPAELSYGDPLGYLPLRETVAQLLASTRGIFVDPGQILITTSAQYGIDLALRLVVDPGDSVIIEDPAYFGFAGAIRATGGVPVPVAITTDGFDPSALDATQTARVACVTPSHQYPTGVVMSLRGRRALLAFAESRNGWIIEDDFEGDLHLDAQAPPPPLFAMGTRDSVIHISSFSKSIFPSLRIGFMVVPPTTAASVLAARSFVDRQPATIPQMILDRFISEGHYGIHLRRMRVLYSARRDAICAALHRHFGDLVTVMPAVAGLHVVATFNEPVDDRLCVELARAQGLGPEAFSPYFRSRPGASGLVIGFGNTPASDADAAIARLAATVHGTVRRRRCS